MAELRDAILAKKKREAQFVLETVAYSGKIVARNGSVNVPGLYDHVWVMPYGEGEPEAVYNRRVRARAGVWVWVGYATGSTVLEILGVDVTTSAGNEPTAHLSLIKHGFTHRRFGDDPVWIERRMNIDGLHVTPAGGLNVRVSPYEYYYQGQRVQFGGLSSLALNLPGAGLQYFALIYLNRATNSISVMYGSAIAYVPGLKPVKPTAPVNSIPAAYVLLYSQTNVRELDIDDARLEWGGVEAAGGGAWPSDNKLMIDTTEYDTLALAVAAATSGDTIKVGPGTFAANNVTLPSGVNLVGTGAGSTIFSHTSHAIGLILSGDNYLAEFSIITNRAAPSEPSENIRPLRLASGSAELFNIAVDLTGSGSGSSCFCFEQASGTTALLRNCRFIVNSATVLTTRAAVATGATLKIEGGFFSGNGGNDLIITGAGGSIEGTLPALANGTILNTGGGGMTGSFVYGGRVKIWGREIQGQEISTPSNPPAGFNSLYFKSDDKLYRLNSAGAEVEVGGGSGAWPADGKAMINTTEYATLALAEAGASPGDTIKVGPGTFTERLQFETAATLKGTSRERTVLHQASPGQALQVKAAAIIEDLKATETWGVYVFAAGAGSVLRNVESAATATILNQVAFEIQGSCLLDHCYGTATGGTSTNRCIRANASGITVTIRGGAYTGAESLYVVSGATVILEGPTLTGSINNSGTVRGWYIDGSTGNIVIVGVSDLKGFGSNAPDIGSTTAAEKFGNIYLASSKDVYPGGDGAGLNQRRLLWTSGVDDLSAFSGYTWATNLHFDGTPVSVDAGTYPSLLWLYDDTDADEFFAYKTGVVYVKACLSVAAYCYGGIRIDDGGAGGSGSENSVELRIVDSASIGLKRLLLHVHAGSSTPTDTYYADGVPPGFYVLQLYSAPGVIYGYWTRDGVFVQNFSATAIGWTPSRVGVLLGNSANSNESVHYDWILMG